MPTMPSILIRLIKIISIGGPMGTHVILLLVYLMVGDCNS